MLDGSSGFVYYVSITGITGTRSAADDDLAAAMPRLRLATELPIAIGFGMRSRAQAAEAVRVADAAVVASALIDTLAANLDAEAGHARHGAARARSGPRAGRRSPQCPHGSLNNATCCI